MLPEGKFISSELSTFVGRNQAIAPLDAGENISKTSKLAGVMEVVISLDELDNADNLEDGKLSNVLLRHHMTSSKEFTNFEPVTPQYKKLKNREFTSLTLRMADQNDNSITDGPGMIIVLHIT